MKKSLILFSLSFWFLTSSPTLVLAQTATLSLSPSTGTFNPGCNISLNVNLDTGGSQTDGTDAIIFYDTTRFTATSITSGTIYPDYPGNNIDPSGKITISGLASVNTPFSGAGTLATVNFTVQNNAPPGAVQIKFDFDPSNKAKTTDSNVVQRGTVVDVLNSVVNGNYIIGAATGSCAGATPAPVVLPNTGQGASVSSSSAIPTKQMIVKTLPPAGSPQLTFTVAIVGSVLTILGILGLALL